MFKNGTKYLLASAFLFVATMLLGSQPARAVLIDQGTTTLDTATALEWLDLTETLGQSYNDVAAGFGGFTTTQGFRFATRSEVSTLFTNAGFSFQDLVFRPTDLAPAQLLLTLLGCTIGPFCTSGPSPTGEGGGFHELEPFDATLAQLSTYNAQSDAGRSGINFAFDKANSLSIAGSYLIRPAQIPEPTTLALVGLALAGLGFSRKRLN